MSDATSGGGSAAAVSTFRREAAAAAESERLAEQYPDDREEILLEAADQWSHAGKHDRALSIYDRLLDGDCDSRDLVEAARISALWDAGRHDRAGEAAARFRQRGGRDGHAWNIVAEMYETADELDTAAEWYTAGITRIVGAASPLTADTVADCDDPLGVETLVIGRHRVRRLLGYPHDQGDDLADDLHRDRSGIFGDPLPLDEAHSPSRLRDPARSDPAALETEIELLAADVAARRATMSAPPTTCVLYWPADEFAAAGQRWPAMVEGYADHDEHRRAVESRLRSLSAAGEPRLAVAPAGVADFDRYMQAESRPHPDRLSDRYAADLEARGRARTWPPSRNDVCWCGSGRKYKKCCGRPDL